MAQIDINELANNANLSLSITSNQEEHPEDAHIRRVKDIVLFSITMGLIVCVFAFCGYLLWSPTAGPEDKKWAMAVATGIISALLGYLTGRNIGVI